jgi:hypothetical protein
VLRGCRLPSMVQGALERGLSRAPGRARPPSPGPPAAPYRAPVGRCDMACSNQTTLPVLSRVAPHRLASRLTR